MQSVDWSPTTECTLPDQEPYELLAPGTRRPATPLLRNDCVNCVKTEYEGTVKRGKFSTGGASSHEDAVYNFTLSLNITIVGTPKRDAVYFGKFGGNVSEVPKY